MTGQLVFCPVRITRRSRVEADSSRRSSKSVGGWPRIYAQRIGTLDIFEVARGHGVCDHSNYVSTAKDFGSNWRVWVERACGQLTKNRRYHCDASESVQVPTAAAVIPEGNPW